jgi:hypothetical protein
MSHQNIFLNKNKKYSPRYISIYCKNKNAILNMSRQLKNTLKKCLENVK